MKVQAKEVFGPSEMNLGNKAEIEQALGIKQADTPQDSVVSGAFKIEATLELALNTSKQPAAEIVVDVVPDRNQFVLRDRIVDADDSVADHTVAGNHDHKYAAIRQRDQFDLVERLIFRWDRSGNPKRASDFAQQLRRTFDFAFYAASVPQFDGKAIQFGLHNAASHQRSTVALVGQLGRHTSRRRV